MEFDRIIADTREAEQRVLGTIIEQASSWDNNLYPEASATLDASDFNFAFHRRLFACMTDAHAEGLAPSSSVLWSKVCADTENREEDNRLFWLVNDKASLSAALGYHCKEVKAASVRRKMQQTARHLDNLSSDSGQDIKEVLAAATKKLETLSRALQPKRLAKASDITNEVFQVLHERRERMGEIPGVSTGFEGVDNVMMGFERGNLYVIGGRPSMGKSCWAFNAAQNIAVGQSIPVAIFSLETSRRGVMERFLVRQAQLHSELLKRGQLHETELTALESAKAEIDRSPIYIFDGTDRISSVAAIRAVIDAMEVKPQVVFIDHFSQMTGDQEKDRVRELEEVSKDLKRLAVELDIAVVVLAQLNRNVEGRRDKRPILSDLKECGGLEQDLDVAMFLFREEYYEPKDDNQGKAEVIVRKNRDGATGTIDMAFNGPLQSFYTIDTGGRLLKLKSYYLTKTQTVTVKQGVNMPKDYYKVLINDEHCYVRGALRLRVWTENMCLEKLTEWHARPADQQRKAWLDTATWLCDFEDEMYSAWAKDCLTALVKTDNKYFDPNGGVNCTVQYDGVAPSHGISHTVDLFHGLEMNNNEINLFGGLAVNTGVAAL